MNGSSRTENFSSQAGSRRGNKIFAVAAAFLVVTAILKLIAVFELPAVEIKPDAVIFFLTKREAMLLAGILEVLIAYVLTVNSCVMTRACLLWMFCLVALVYHAGVILLPDADGCACLGLMETWIGDRSSELISLTMLLLLAALGVLAIRSGKAQVYSAKKCSTKSLIIISGYFLSTNIHYLDASVEVKGKYHYISEHGRPIDKYFNAEFDRDTLVIQYVTVDAGPYVQGGPCTNVTRIDPSIITTHTRCQGIIFETLRLDDANLSYELGNCGTDIATALFLTLKVEALFPLGKKSGERRLAPTQATIGLPLSLVTIGKWKYEDAAPDVQLFCDIIIDKQLLKIWPSSPFLFEELRTDESRMRRERYLLSRYKSGMVVEKLRWGKLTNVSGITFASRFEAERQHLIFHRDIRLQTELRRSWIRVLIDDVREKTDSLRTIFPLRGVDIHVTETRLRDSQRGISFVAYRTNFVESPAITDEAMVDFARRQQSADERAKLLRSKKLFTIILILLVFLMPIILVIIKRHRYTP